MMMTTNMINIEERRSDYAETVAEELRLNGINDVKVVGNIVVISFFGVELHYKYAYYGKTMYDYYRCLSFLGGKLHRENLHNMLLTKQQDNVHHKDEKGEPGKLGIDGLTIEQLNADQQRTDKHPLTCNRSGEDDCERNASFKGTPRNSRDAGLLIATDEGWTCPCGAYKQNY